MCVIVVKPLGIEMPNKITLKNCWAWNSDGAGVSIVNKKTKTIITQKGFMEFNDLIDYLNKLEKMYDIKKSVIMIHFRMTSRGVTCKEQCHPFPISYNYSDTTRLCYLSDRVFAHNGTLSIKTEKNASDTQTFAYKYIPYLNKKELKNIKYNKFCILNKDTTFELIGDFIQHKGCYFSNDWFKYSKTSLYL